MSSIRVFRDQVPTLDVPQMQEVDRLMIEGYGISLLQMMENAGRCLAVLARDRFLDGNPEGKTVVVLAGKGNNGGGALAAARRLANWGALVQVFLSHDQHELTGTASQQYLSLQAMGVPLLPASQLPKRIDCELLIDGIIGYRLNGAPHGMAKTMIEWCNRQPSPTLSLDTPSGVELSEGQVFVPAVKARATLTLALPKKGLYAESALACRGELYLGDISVPNELYRRESLGLEVPLLFAESDVVRLV